MQIERGPSGPRFRMAQVENIADFRSFYFDPVFGRRVKSRISRRSISARSHPKGPDVNKNDLIAEVADRTGLSRADATKAVDYVFDTITDALKKGDEVRLVGFGTFTVSARAATEGRNPRTGETIKIPASKQPKFKAGKGLKDAVNS